MRLFPFAVVAAALVAGCSSEAPRPEPSAESPSAPVMLAGVDLGQPLRAVGTEPFWGVELTGAEIVYSGVDRPEQRGPQRRPVVQGTVATWETTTVQGQALAVTLTATECSDGMSDRVYPLTALVRIGQEQLNGCAATTAAIMGAPESGPVQAPQPQPMPEPMPAP